MSIKELEKEHEKVVYPVIPWDHPYLDQIRKIYLDRGCGIAVYYGKSYYYEENIKC